MKNLHTRMLAFLPKFIIHFSNRIFRKAPWFQHSYLQGASVKVAKPGLPGS
jgi:hypothetical protein